MRRPPGLRGRSWWRGRGASGDAACVGHRRWRREPVYQANASTPIASGTPTRRFKHWLQTTALRKIQHRREHWLAQKRDAQREVPLQAGAADTDAGLVACYSTFSTPSKHAAVREEMERVEAAFDQLSEEQREIVTLAHLVGLSRAEIAERLGKPEGSVRVSLYRSLAKLSGLLGG